MSFSQEDIIQAVEEIIDQYKHSVKIKFKEKSETHPEAFPIIKFNDYLSIVRLVLNSNYFTRNEFIIITDNLEEYFQTIDHSDLEIARFGEIYDQPVDELKVEKIIKDGLISKLENKNIHAVFRLDDLEFSYKNAGGRIANSHYERFKMHNNKSVKSFDHSLRQSFSHYDIQPIIDRVDDNDFEYQIDQALECFSRSLYLPAAATFCVALETLLTLILEKNGQKVKDSDSTLLGELAEKLKSKEIINYREKKRLDIAYDLRNTISHTNKGKVIKTDCDVIVNTINQFAEEYF
ncbi:hypothetical protein [Salibacterium sp. K-3]